MIRRVNFPLVTCVSAAILNPLLASAQFQVIIPSSPAPVVVIDNGPGDSDPKANVITFLISEEISFGGGKKAILGFTAKQSITRATFARVELTDLTVIGLGDQPTGLQSIDFQSSEFEAIGDADSPFIGFVHLSGSYGHLKGQKIENADIDATGSALPGPVVIGKVDPPAAVNEALTPIKFGPLATPPSPDVTKKINGGVTQLKGATRFTVNPGDKIRVVGSATIGGYRADRIFTVDSLADAQDNNLGDGICGVAGGGCTLRAALTEADQSNIVTAIHFNLPVAPNVVPTIQIDNSMSVNWGSMGALQSVIIDGATQPAGRVELDGSLAASQDFSGNSIVALDMVGANSMVRGLVINRFPGNAIQIRPSGPDDGTNNVISDNLIGTDATGTIALPNGGIGVSITNRPNNFILDNIIADDPAVVISGSMATGNVVSANMTFNNGGPGIVLPDNTNQMQTAPYLVAAASDDDTVTVFGRLTNAAFAPLQLEFFSNSATNSPGGGHASTFLGFANVTTDTNGVAAFTVALAENVATGQVMFASATDTNSNTSPFSAPRLVLGMDADGDGLPTIWEAMFGLDPLSASGNDGADGDPDGDGLTNLQEYLAGTDPLNGQGQNQPPQLAAIDPQFVDEGALLGFVVTASDPNAGDQLSFSLLPDAPTGASINPTNGLFDWTPTEEQGPGVYAITVEVTDNDTPPLGATTNFSVTVNEVNSSPTLASIQDQSTDQGCNLSFVISATDPDIPPNTLSYLLGPGAQAEASIDSVSGLFTWTPPDPGTYHFTVEVTDDGSPSMSVTQSFNVIVNQAGSFWSNSNNVTRLGPDSVIGFSHGPSSPFIVHVDADNTVHCLFNAQNRTNDTIIGPVFHTFKRPGELWSPLAQLNGQGFVQFVAEDRGSLHVWFEDVPGQGPIWHSELNLTNLAAGWSTNENVSQTESNAVSQNVLVDTNGTLHLLFSSGPAGMPRLFHSYKRLGQSWSAPIAISPTNEVATTPRLLADQSSNLHVLFQSYRLVAGETYNRMRYATLDINNLPAGWSANTNLNWEPRETEIRGVVVDAANRLHLLCLFFPQDNGGNLFHRFRTPDGIWSSPIQVSQVGTNVMFGSVLEDSRGRLHVLFTASPSNQIWHSQLDLTNLAAGWSINANVSQTMVSKSLPAPLISRDGTLHVVFATFGNPSSLFHNYLMPGGEWTTPLRIDDQTGLEFSSVTGLLAEDSMGLQLVFYSFPTNQMQVLHSQLDFSDIESGWSPVESVLSDAGTLQQSSIVMDSQQRLHLVATSPDALVYRSKTPGQAWSCPTPVGMANQYARTLMESPDGTLQLFYGAFKDQIWHRELATLVSSPRIRSLRLVGQRIQVILPAIPGYSYQLQFKDSLTDAQWQDIPGTPTTDQEMVTLEDAAPLGVMRFYRVSVQPADQ